MKTILQIPLNINLRKEAEKQALEQGFSSLQEAVRIFLNKLARGVIDFALNDEESVQLSPKAAKRYDKMIDDIKSGKEKVYKAESIEDLMRQLNS